MRGFLSAWLVCLLSAQAARASSSYLYSVSEGMAYLKIPQGARSSGMGTAMVARRAGVEGLWYNPASIHGSSQVEATFSRMAWIGGTHDDYLAASIRLSPRHSLGVYGNLVSADDSYRDAQGNEGATFTNSASVYGMAWGVDWGAIGIGVGIKRAQESFAGSQGGVSALDLGMQGGFWDKHIRLGAAAQNLSFTDTGYYGSNAVDAPITLRLGLAVENAYPGLIVSYENRWSPWNSESSNAAGVEYLFQAGILGLALRAGYEGAAARLGDMGGLTLGTGFSLGELQADFAWLPQGALGNPYRLTLTWLYGKEPQPKPRPKRRRLRVRYVEDEDLARSPVALSPLPKALDLSSAEDRADLLQTGHELEDAGDFERALKVYGRLTVEAPDEPSAWKALGRLQYRLKNRPEALRAFEHVLALRPSPELKAFLDKLRAETTPSPQE